MKPFLDALRDAPLLWDGAMGSLLYERGVFLTHSFDELNLSQPELISLVHRDYIDAGADIIETNTFGANRVALAKHGYAEKTTDINAAAVRIARQAREGRDVYLAGAVGPTGIEFDDAAPREQARARDAIEEQVGTLVQAGVDLLLLETFVHPGEIEAAIGVTRAIGAGIPVVAQVVFGPDGLARGGLSPRDVARRLADAGADVVGANCGAGPPELFDVGTQMVSAGVPVSVQPNAGLPRVVEGRTIYIANPEHFGVFARRLLQAGVRLVGGCCGTTPEHTRRMLGAVRMIGARPLPTRIEASASSRAPQRSPCAKKSVPFSERSSLAAKLAAGKFVVSCELSAPAGTDTQKTIAAARRLKEGGVDVVNIADGPRATARMSNLALCALIEREAGMETILHACCRDHNLLGLVAHLLGAHALGIRNLVVITGDPPKIGDYPFATPVYDVDSVGLLRVAADLNRGLDPGGKEIAGQSSFLLATGAEPGALDYDRELRRLEMKKEAGAELIMTQPVYDARLMERFLEDIKPLGLPVMLGLLPLASHRNAEFLHNTVPGMRIPGEIRARMAQVGSGPAARSEGVRIAQEALLAMKPRVAGAYIMPPFDRVDSALEILHALSA
ncbi:MAG: bifunctional homocysteine S-methyltransferase/methylenetetrahydrofolate reductase [Deltaproteobacteria bacterium]|nr:bifunctional homocysteine S-methyltransferase/methylenetetrahydrofolate reductase [Deltaproteobacteria bacterium]